jgi:hypothetical protein
MAFQKIYLPFHNAGTSFGCNTPILASIGTPEIPKQQSRGTGVAMLPSVGHPSTGQNRCRRGESVRRLLPGLRASVCPPRRLQNRPSNGAGLTDRSSSAATDQGWTNVCRAVARDVREVRCTAHGGLPLLRPHPPDSSAPFGFSADDLATGARRSQGQSGDGSGSGEEIWAGRCANEDLRPRQAP